MSIPLTIGNQTFDYPESGDAPNWGEEATAWAEAVSDLLATLQGPNDIALTTATIANNTSSPTNINGLAFNNAAVRSATIDYAIYRVTNTTELAEAGTLHIVYKNGANAWNVVRSHNDEGGVDFTVLASGQVQYTSTNVSGTGYSGTIKFRARTISQ